MKKQSSALNGTVEFNKARKEALEWLEMFVVSVLVVVLLFTFVFRMVGISGSSMENTVFENERVLIRSAFYTPEQGDIVVISRDYMQKKDDPIIKRVIATEGQEVYLDFESNTVYVDGVALNEPYVKGSLSMGSGMQNNPHVVAENCVFVLGDHRSVSLDSRAMGDIKEEYILGKAFLRVYPFESISVLE
ncbi:MAG: signal peptidase I [Clostridia bacterium]|nr:signal peptidase I [Clostridia bacterium]